MMEMKSSNSEKADEIWEKIEELADAMGSYYNPISIDYP
jgi:dihydrodipicolinate synthase/N-acetylneuraminate lyase